jgi:hypothetical protein
VSPECYDRVKVKTDARKAKAASVCANKESAALRITQARSSQLEYGSTIAGMLKDSSHIAKLKVPQLTALLTFKAVTLKKGMKKPDLVEAATSAMCLPSAETPPPLLALPEPPAVDNTASESPNEVVPPRPEPTTPAQGESSSAPLLTYEGNSSEESGDSDLDEE